MTRDRDIESAPPLVSVVIPAYNAADTIGETLDSVLSQSWPRIEIIVVDDGSHDRTRDVLARYVTDRSSADRPLRIVAIENSGGPSRPRNIGVMHAMGDLVAFFDSDDVMEPDKLAICAKALMSLDVVDLVFTNFRSIDLAGRILVEDYLAEYQEFRKDLSSTHLPDVFVLRQDATLRRLLQANFIGTSSVVCRREILSAAGGFDETMKNSDDVDMWRRLAARGRTFAFVDHVLHSYRVNPHGVTARGADRIPAMIHGLLKHLSSDTDPELARDIEEQVSRLLRARAWALRERGQLVDATKCYWDSMKYRVSMKALVGLGVTAIRAMTRRKRSP